MKFTKMHGLGNDFLVIDARRLTGVDFNALAPRLCHRQTGVGADGLLLVLPAGAAADVRMRIINSDGSEAEMCGNGIRCFARYVYEQGIVRRSAFAVETLAGVVRPQLLLEDGRVSAVRVDMGVPLLERRDIPALGEGRCLEQPLEVGGQTLTVTAVRVGVPHAILFVDDLAAVDVAGLGALVERAPLFPQRANVDFVRLIDGRTVEMRTWERGCGRTLACGTGACSTAVACALTGRTGRSVDVRIELGTLHVDWAADNHVYMTGPAAFVCTGETPDYDLTDPAD